MGLEVDTVVKQLAESSIIAQGKLENFIPPKAQPKDADELIAQLIKSGDLSGHGIPLASGRLPIGKRA